MVEIIIEAIFTLFGGIGLFLIACNMMSGGIESLSSARLKKLFDKTSRSKLAGVAIGTLSTAIIQSSGAVSVMVIGFVGANIMTLPQAACIIFGANVGTTITGQLTALGLVGGNLPLDVIFGGITIIGAIISLGAKKDKTNTVGKIISGFGMLFISLTLMSSSMDSFKDLDTVKSFLSKLTNPLVLIIVGTLITGIIQSSSVITSIAITMAYAGLINLDQGIYLTMGANIGSCIVGILASIGTSINARRTAHINLHFNLIGVLLFYLIGFIMNIASRGTLTYGSIFDDIFKGAPGAQLAMFHTIFNVVSVAIILPFTNTLVALVCKLVKDKGTTNETCTCNKQRSQIERNSRNSRR